MKFSIVTPCFNAERWIAETIESIFSQEGDFSIEYIIRDGGSTDNTIEIIKKYEETLKHGDYPIRCKNISLSWVSEKDAGMYDAINKGFATATGDVYAYINADDLYLPGALRSIAQTFEAFPKIEWLKGTSGQIDEDSALVRHGKCFLYDQVWLARGIYGMQAYFVEQDSVFWRAGLWKKISAIPTSYRVAGDYWLWTQFAKFAPLWSLNVEVSMFRKSSAQQSKQIAKYKAEQRDIQSRLVRHALLLQRIFFSLWSRCLPHAQSVFLFLYPIFFPKQSSLPYLTVTNGKIEKKKARSFLVA